MNKEFQCDLHPITINRKLVHRNVVNLVKLMQGCDSENPPN